MGTIRYTDLFLFNNPGLNLPRAPESCEEEEGGGTGGGGRVPFEGSGSIGVLRVEWMGLFSELGWQVDVHSVCIYVFCVRERERGRERKRTKGPMKEKIPFQRPCMHVCMYACMYV